MPSENSRDNPGGTVGRASALMAAGTIVSRVLGLVRGLLLASVVGLAASTADAFDVANTLPNSLYILLAGGILNAVLVPQIVRARSAADGGEDFVSRLITLAVLLILGATVVCTLAAPWLISLFSRFKLPETYELAVVFGYICIPQVFFYGLYTLLGQVLNAHHRFTAYMWAPVLANLVSIAGLLAFRGLGFPVGAPPSAWTPAMIAVLAGSATFSIAVQAACLLIPLRRLGFRYRPRFGWRGVGLGRAGTVAKWTFLAVLVSQLGYAVTSQVLTAAQEAGVLAHETTAGRAAFSYAFLIAMMPHSFITVSLVTALFTRMSQQASAGATAEVLTDARTGLRMPSVALVPMATFLAFFAPLVARVLFPGNAPAETAALAPVVAALALGIVPFGWVYVNERLFYAHEDARTPFLLQLCTTAIAVTGALVAISLIPTLRATTIGLFQSAAYLVSALAGFVIVQRRFGSLQVGALVPHVLRLLVPSVLSAAACWWLAGLLLPALPLAPGRALWAAQVATLAVAGVLHLLLSLAVGHALGVREVGQLLDPVRRRLGRGSAAS